MAKRFLLSMLAASVHAQCGSAYWGVQGEGAYFVAPQFLVEKIHSLPEIPTVEGPSFQTGLVRFNGRGAPSFALQYSQMSADVEGSAVDSRGRITVTGSGLARGFMATKYINFVTRGRVSAGLAVGGGIGSLQASYTRSAVSSTGVAALSERHDYDYTIGLFEILGRADFRLNRFLTIGPFYGARNGFIGGGAAVRVDFAH